jgi:hypothetical protein
MDKKERLRAQFILISMLSETRAALVHLSEVRPKIFRRNLARIIFEHRNSTVIANKLGDAITYFGAAKRVDWEALEQVGLSGTMLEWKADLFYRTLGKQKPPGPERRQTEDVLTQPQTRPVWGRLFKLLKSFFGSLIEAVQKDSRIRMALDFIKEFIECLDASVKFIQGGQEASE